MVIIIISMRINYIRVTLMAIGTLSTVTVTIMIITMERICIKEKRVGSTTSGRRLISIIIIMKRKKRSIGCMDSSNQWYSAPNSHHLPGTISIIF